MRTQFALVAALSATAVAGPVAIDFENMPLGTIVSDQFESDHILFSGDIDLPAGLDLGQLENPVARDVSGFFGPDDTTLVAAGLGVGLLQATIRIETTEGHFDSLAFDLVRRNDQDIHINVELLDGSIVTRNFAAPGGNGLELFRWSETMLQTNRDIRAIEIHNGGGTFGVDNLLATVALPLPSGSALAGAGLLVVGARRRRGA